MCQNEELVAYVDEQAWRSGLDGVRGHGLDDHVRDHAVDVLEHRNDDFDDPIQAGGTLDRRARLPIGAFASNNPNLAAIAIQE